jgi:hypothetical protein
MRLYPENGKTARGMGVPEAGIRKKYPDGFESSA